MTSTLDAFLRHRLQRRRGVELQPFGAAKAALEGDAVLLRPGAPALRRAGGRSSGIRSGRVALVQREARYAVETHHQLVGAVGAAVLHPVLADAGGKRLDIAGEVAEAADRAHLGLVTLGGEPAPGFVERGGAGAAGVLRVERHEQEAVAAGGLELVDYRRPRAGRSASRNRRRGFGGRPARAGP